MGQRFLHLIYPGEVSSEVASGFQLNFTWAFKLTKAQESSPQSALSPVVNQWVIFIITWSQALLG